MLPGMDGLELCRILRSNSPTAEIPIIMLTAKGEESDVTSGLDIGAEITLPSHSARKYLSPGQRPFSDGK